MGEGKGATSVLRNVGGRVDIDRSLHQDRYVPAPGVAGPSRQAPQRPQGVQSNNAPNAFDLGALRQHLQPTSQRPVQRENWAESFSPGPMQSQGSAGKQRMEPQRSASPWQQDFLQSQTPIPQASSNGRLHQPNTAPWQVPNQVYRPHYMPPAPQPQFFAPPPPPQLYQPSATYTPQNPLTYDRPRPQTETEQYQQATQPDQPLTESQEVLARTARELVSDLDASSEILRDNPKLAQSQFMQLMRGLGDGEIMVEDGKARVNGEEVGEGARFVSRPAGDWASAFVDQGSAQVASPVPEQAQARTLPAGLDVPDFYARQQLARRQEQMYSDQSAIAHPTEAEASTFTRPNGQRRKSVHFDEADMPQLAGSGVPNNLEEALRASTSMPGMTSQWEEDGLDLDDFDETAFMNYNGHLRQGTDTAVGSGIGDMENWGGMQRDWDEFQRSEPTLRGASEVNRYLFQSRNPYASMAGDADMGRESPTLKGVLELEGAVQHDPSDHEAWYALGLKQQENEREDQAIRALSKVIDLDPDYRPAYLALAVSYTNEGTHQKARVMLDRWIQMAQNGGPVTETDDLAAAFNHQQLVERLIDLARTSPEEVDPDVQIALGVLFNSSEEYTKAEDCFLAALSVRPDDWLLHNRLGATLANSGRSNEAISYYHKALSLHPSFVRALFNLGISYINLAQYPLAAQHIISAIRLQHSDATEAYVSGTIGTSAKGVTSDALWNSLRTACLHMGRHDLVEMAAKKDVTAFPDTFDHPPSREAQTLYNIMPMETGEI